MHSELQKGQRVYLPDGRVAEYVGRLDNRHAVRALFTVPDDPDYQYPDDKVTLASQVFLVAPVEWYDEEIAKRLRRIADLNAEIERLKGLAPPA